MFLVILVISLAIPTLMKGEDEKDLIGGMMDVDLKDKNESEKITNLAYHALVNYNNKNNKAYLEGLVRLKEAQKQIVTGVMYYIDFYAGPTTCRKNGTVTVKNLKTCPLAKTETVGGEFLLCSAEMWEKPAGARKFRKQGIETVVTKLDCTKVSKKDAQA